MGESLSLSFARKPSYVFTRSTDLINFSGYINQHNTFGEEQSEIGVTKSGTQKIKNSKKEKKEALWIKLILGKNVFY